MLHLLEIQGKKEDLFLTAQSGFNLVGEKIPTCEPVRRYHVLFDQATEIEGRQSAA
jgi:hypothetical protein